MRKIVYYVAASLDGFISGPDGDISGFVQGGNGVDRYFKDLAEYDTVIMGRNTYEFGYKFGLQPGQPAYANMQHYIFSDNLVLENSAPSVHIKKPDLSEILALKAQNGSDIYLCGGGQFAGWLLENGQVDLLKIKLNPFIQGTGVRLFGDSTKAVQMELVDSEQFEHGLQIMTYRISNK